MEKLSKIPKIEVTPFDIDKCFGSYYTTQKSKLKSYMHYPGLEVFPMMASKINIGFLDLKEGSHVRGAIIHRTINDASNTVLLWIGDRYLNAIPITPYLYLMYSYNMQKCLYVKRCFHTRDDSADACGSGRCMCVSYHYYKVDALFPEADSKSTKAMISTGIFCNAQCGRHKLSTAVFERMTYQKLLELLSVFKDPSTRIGGEKTTVVHRNEGASRVRSRTGSGSDDDRRVLIPDVDEGGMEDEAMELNNDDDIDDDITEDNNEEDANSVDEGDI